MDWSDDSQIPGATVGNFRLEGPLAPKVWRAIRLSDRRNALFWRLDRAGLSLPLHGVPHEGVRPLWASDALDATHAYLITPAPSGPNLDDLLEEGPLAPAHASRVLINIASALAAFHEAGQILANLATHDVHLGSDWQSDATVELPAHSALLGAAVGRQIAGYAGPENDPASGYPFDHRADQFSLGVIGFELLTGTTPHNPDAPPGERTLLPSMPHPQVPDALEGVLGRLLDPRPDRRFATDDEVIAALQQAAAALGPSQSFGQFTPVMSTRRHDVPQVALQPSMSNPPDDRIERNLAFITSLFILMIAALSISTIAVVLLS